ncbi:MAG: ferric reductase-like transmembrane domain-containing protein [Chloroflexota bacterium]
MKNPFLRTLLTFVLSAALVWFFTLGRQGLHPIHLWNRALADAAYVLLCLILVIGPLAQFAPSVSALLPWRRELGVGFTALAIAHVLVYAQGDFGRFFVGQEQHQSFLLHNAFAAANWIGLLALIYAIVLALTSNDASQRLLGRGWKFLQQQSYTLFILTLLHAGLLLYLFIREGFGLFRPLFWLGGLATVSLQLVGYTHTVYRQAQRRSRHQPRT